MHRSCRHRYISLHGKSYPSHYKIINWLVYNVSWEFFIVSPKASHLLKPEQPGCQLEGWSETCEFTAEPSSQQLAGFSWPYFVSWCPVQAIVQMVHSLN